MESNLTKSLGRGKVNQTSIDSKINLDEITNILDENLIFFENQINKDDKHALEVYNFFKLKAENQIIKPGTYNYFRYETTEFDNISSETLNEFNAELSSESINLELR